MGAVPVFVAAIRCLIVPQSANIILLLRRPLACATPMPTVRSYRLDAWIPALLFAVGAGLAVFAGLMIVSWHAANPCQARGLRAHSVRRGMGDRLRQRCAGAARDRRNALRRAFARR